MKKIQNATSFITDIIYCISKRGSAFRHALVYSYTGWYVIVFTYGLKEKLQFLILFIKARQGILRRYNYNYKKSLLITTRRGVILLPAFTHAKKYVASSAHCVGFCTSFIGCTMHATSPFVPVHFFIGAIWHYVVNVRELCREMISAVSIGARGGSGSNPLYVHTLQRKGLCQSITKLPVIFFWNIFMAFK